MDWSLRLNAALDYLAETWDREPDLECAAALANCSAFHFFRVFEVVSGLTPGEYSRRRRLSRAAIDLSAGRDKVIEVALRYGYENPESFAKVFKRLFGLTPSDAKLPGQVLRTYPPLRITAVLQGEVPLSFRIVEKQALTVVGWPLRTSCFQGQNHREIPQFWTECQKGGRVQALVPLIQKLGFIGLCCEWDRGHEEFTYVVGVDTAPDVNLPPGTQKYTVAPATYAVFESVGAMPHAIQNVWERAFNEWFPTSGYEHADALDFEVYPLFAPNDSRGDAANEAFVSEVWIPLCRTRSPR